MSEHHIPEAHIQLEGASKRYALPGGEHFDAVRDVSLRVTRGEALGIIGQSGAGKSTLLRLINLLERPDSGNVLLDGRELTRLGKSDLRAVRREIGMIFQQFNLLQNLTVAENVAFPLRVAGTPRGEIALRVAENLERVGLAGKAAAYPAQLSGGQKQRVGIARALVTRPSVLLCDEPTSALDAQTTRSVLELLSGIHRELGVTIVIVTHELAVARALCQRVAVLEQGRLVEEIRLDAPAEQSVIRPAVAQPITELARELLRGHSAREAAHV
ncbi:methionine ABC transporter ATP-binding protein [Chitinimonas sp.]|uniref:methionine ABC transporter ATP-binding protein n=1 Tax=Chitinimonas sp. TaxID=1934313 RepID=UPI002F92DCB2